jgi:hypothetical protein
MFESVEVVFCVFCVLVALSSMVSFLLPSIIKSNGRDGNALTNNQRVLLREFVCGNLEVQGGGTLADTARNVVM